MILSLGVARRSAAACLGILLAGAGACLRLPVGLDEAGIPCFTCPTTTSVSIVGDSAVAVGDTLRLRAMAYMQNIAFMGGSIPSRSAAWTVTPEGAAEATLVVVRATADTATWGRAILVGRAPGTLVVRAREGSIDATRTVTVLPDTARLSSGPIRSRPRPTTARAVAREPRCDPVRSVGMSPHPERRPDALAG